VPRFWRWLWWEVAYICVYFLYIIPFFSHCLFCEQLVGGYFPNSPRNLSINLFYWLSFGFLLRRITWIILQMSRNMHCGFGVSHTFVLVYESSVCICYISWNISDYEWPVPALMSSAYLQDYGYGSVRSTASVTSSGSHHKLENIDWNQQQGHRSETVSPEGQKPPEQVSLCHPHTSQHKVMLWNHTDE
jgi:hypothetical protein